MTAADEFVQFVYERHAVYTKRQLGQAQPWTSEPILASKKFTNVYRVLDPGSQFIFNLSGIRLVSERELLMRLFMYRYTNRPSAWEMWRLQHGSYPMVADLDALEALWAGMQLRNDPVFSGAYMILPAPGQTGDKVGQVINLVKRLFIPRSPQDVVPDFLRARTWAEKHAILKRNNGVGDFMALQILTDWGYCGSDFHEDEFVVAGPGSRRGARRIFPAQDPVITMRWAQKEISSVTLQGRPPSLMDSQNCLCEFDKYMRWKSRGVSTVKPYRPAHPGSQLEPTLPTWW